MPVHMDHSEAQDNPNGTRRRRRSQIFSLPFSLKASSKRSSVINVSPTRATCQERDNYPIFDPTNPSHNPFGWSQPWGRHESQTSSSDSQKQPHWIQDFPLRSLRKARSGLLALRAGLRFSSSRHSTDQTDGASEPHIRRGHRKRRGHAKFSMSGASTQEDLSFGVDALMTAASLHTLKRVISSSAPLAQSNDHSCQAQSATIDTVSTTCDQQPTPTTNHDSSVNSRTSDGQERNPDTRQLVVDNTDDTRTYHDRCLTHSTLSSESRDEKLRLLDESMDEVSEICNVGTSVAANRPGTTPTGSEASFYRSSENLSVGKETERPGSLTHEQHDRDSLAGSFTSFTLPDPETLSILSSNAPHGLRLRVTQSEAFTSEERLQLPRGSESFETCAPPVEGSRQCSTEVRIAFPGIHHALMEQWVQESSESTQPHNVEGDVALDSIPVAVPTASTQTVSEAPSTFPDDSSCGAVQTDLVSAPERPAETRHSFGLHISLRDAADRTESNERRSYPVSRQSFERHSPVHNRYSFPTTGASGTIGSLYDESDFSTSYTQGSTAASAEVTSATSMSNSGLSPLDSPIDEEVFFSGFFRDEYYMADGKTSSHYPDRGDLPVKAARRVIGDGSIYSGPGLSRASSCRTREVAEMMPVGTIRPSQAAVQALMRSEETEPADESTAEQQAQSRNLH